MRACPAGMPFLILMFRQAALLKWRLWLKEQVCACVQPRLYQGCMCACAAFLTLTGPIAGLWVTEDIWVLFKVCSFVLL